MFGMKQTLNSSNSRLQGDCGHDVGRALLRTFASLRETSHEDGDPLDSTK
jgi:hypothetical protein